ncbi:MAG: hypothetical protein KF819_02430 [Labilithrix sp.]|nr:hypothetical protein [Labilithrix sp.]
MRPLVRLALLALVLSMAACAGLLGIKPRDAQRPFEHRAHALAGVSCVTCHEGVARAGDRGDLHLPSTSTCTTCHERPHDTRPCGNCHGDRRTREESALAREHLRFAHDAHVPKVGGECVPCHAAAGKKEQAKIRPPMAQCFGCHAHEKQWSTRECDGCHADLPAELERPSSHVIHDGDFVREHGVRAASARDLCATCHSEASCAACHGVSTAALPWRFSFDKPRLTGLHRAGFGMRHADEARAAPGLCSTCHESERFCLDCHATRGRAASAAAGAARNPHPPDWVRARGGGHGRAARLDPGGCASCHGGSGEALCVGCHRVGGPGGNPHGRGFASALDARRDEPCRQCHAP